MQTENSILAPTNPYACTKAAAEFICRAYLMSFGLPIVMTRGNNVYGPHQFPDKLISKSVCLLLEVKTIEEIPHITCLLFNLLASLPPVPHPSVRFVSTTTKKHTLFLSFFFFLFPSRTEPKSFRSRRRITDEKLRLRQRLCEGFRYHPPPWRAR